MMKKQDRRSGAEAGKSRVDVDHNRRVYAVLCSGTVDEDRALLAARQLCRQVSEMGYALLVDLEGARLELSEEAADPLLEETANPWQWKFRVALVGGEDPSTLRWLGFLAGVAPNYEVAARVFRDRGKAKEWAAAAAVDPLEGIAREGLRILVVDDEPDVRELSARTLTRAGFRVTTAGSGEEGLEAARRQVPDLILLDVVLGDMDGRDVCRKLRAMPSLADSYVALASGRRTEVGDQATGLEAGANGYIPRPLGNKELVARMEVLLLRRELDRRVGRDD